MFVDQTDRRVEEEFRYEYGIESIPDLISRMTRLDLIPEFQIGDVSVVLSEWVNSLIKDECGK